MKLVKRIPTQEELRALMHYDPETGLFTHLQSRGKGRAGQTVGKIDAHGYIKMRVFNRLFGAHQLAFIYMTGSYPQKPMTVDHINGDRTDNRWCNLRAADYYEQSWNSVAHKRNKSGLKGAWPCKATGRWISMLEMDRKRIWIGRFDTAEDAHRAWINTARKVRGDEWVQRAIGVADA